MHPLQTLIVTALPLLVSSSTLQQCLHPRYFSSVLDSLQCYNDLTTYIRCTWEEDPHAHFNLSEITGESPCVSDGPSYLLPNGKTFRSCLYKTLVFTLSSHTFFFNVSCPSKVTVFNVAQQGKVLPPVNLTVRGTESGGRMLSWSSPYSSNHTLTYQLKYRRHGHDWTVVNTTSFELVIEKTALVPGYSYEARVRACGRVGLWSDWSPPVSWTTEEGEAVLNLQCVLVDMGLACSWQVKREHAQVLSYFLCLRGDGNNQCNQSCEQCTVHAGELQHTDALLNITCLVVSRTPELLTVEIRSIHARKEFQDQCNFHPPRPRTVQVDNKDGIWRVRWFRPKVNIKVELFYQVCVRRSNIQASEECYNITDNIVTNPLSFDIPHSSLLHQTQYMAQARTLPGVGRSGRPSDWSEPVYFTTDPAPSINTFIYISTGVLVLMFSIVLYNALPACHRKLELWKVSIPSPIKSKVLKEMSSRKPPAGWTYSANEKTSVCIMQASDNPIICQGSILEYPLLTYSDDSSVTIGMMKADWTHGSNGSSSTEDSRMMDTSGMSFLGPYILCCQESMLQSELSDPSFSPLLSYDNENALDSKSTSDSSLVKGGYVFSPPTILPSTDDSAPSSPPSPSREPSLSEPQKDNPPAYSPGPGGMPFPHPSGYCLMPRMDLNAADWAQASASPPKCDTENHPSKTTEGDEHACSYVTLSQPGI
ncbi:cytokine receptor common subunit beta isoform X1 [Electrophorus electricus]|uniref:cytokine receptor common subunit beta isoform X1 n=1 Tax=Electrophorus electricus TaxID=8005 RepID=UPI0015D031D9|nr:cytokine receptor common subunit beta isoform X1 [Electrophorus electricus]XP_026853620.2 cytokine receptor common subunit beta isoform X1 [Electrophorus electricus]